MNRVIDCLSGSFLLYMVVEHGYFECRSKVCDCILVLCTFYDNLKSMENINSSFHETGNDRAVW